MADMHNESTNSHNNKLIRSFGRIKSRKLSDNKNRLLDELYPRYSFNKEHLPKTELCLEIGFGFGDFLFEKTKNNPQQFFIGCEPHINGIVNLLAKLEKEPLANLNLFKDDVRILLDNLDDHSLSEVYILFPDPWPKLKHFKRRLINEEFLNLLSKKIKPQGKLIIATDHDSYKTWILSVISDNKNFSWLANSKKDWQIFPDWWITTKYQKKAAQEGRQSVIFNLINHD